MEERTYARGLFEESRDRLSDLRYEYRALAQESSKMIKINDADKTSLLLNDLGEPEKAIGNIKKLVELKPQILKLQKEVKELKDKWNF